MNTIYRVIVPATWSGGQVPVGRVVRQMAEHFGGATAMPAFGAWKDGHGEMVGEQVVVVWAAVALVEPGDRTKDAWMSQFAARLARDYGQECVYWDRQNAAVHFATAASLGSVEP